MQNQENKAELGENRKIRLDLENLGKLGYIQKTWENQARQGEKRKIRLDQVKNGKIRVDYVKTGKLGQIREHP